MKVWWKMVREIVFPVVIQNKQKRKIDGKLHIDHGCKVYNTDLNQKCLGWSLWCDEAGEEVSLKCDLWFFRKFQKCIFEIIIMKMFGDRENHFDLRSGFWEGVWSSHLFHVISLTAKYGRKCVSSLVTQRSTSKISICEKLSTRIHDLVFITLSFLPKLARLLI